MKVRHIIAAAAAVVIIGSGVAYGTMVNHSADEITQFYPGHTHDELGDTHGAPQHSGGTDAYGCHNASKPYHCH